MDTLQDLLGKYTPQEPSEAALAKQYIADTFGLPATVAVNETTIIITVKSASLANALRLRSTALRAACATEKRFIFRIG